MGQERVEERHPLRGDGRLEVEVVSHSVRVHGWDREEVQLTGTLDPATQRLEISGSDEELHIRVVHERGSRSGHAGELELHVPSGARLGVGTVSGSAWLEGVTGEVHGATTSGSLELLGSTPSHVTMATVSGSIRVEATSPDLRLTTVSGAISATGATGRAELTTVSGGVRLEAAAPLEQVRVNSVSGPAEVRGPLAERGVVEVESHSGSIRLGIPPDTPADFEVNTFSGAIRNELTGDEPSSPRFGPGRSLNFRTGDGSIRIRLRTFSGQVTLEPSGGGDR